MEHKLKQLEVNADCKNVMKNVEVQNQNKAANIFDNLQDSLQIKKEVFSIKR